MNKLKSEIKIKWNYRDPISTIYMHLAHAVLLVKCTISFVGQYVTLMPEGFRIPASILSLGYSLLWSLHVLPLSVFPGFLPLYNNMHLGRLAIINSSKVDLCVGLWDGLSLYSGWILLPCAQHRLQLHHVTDQDKAVTQDVKCFVS